MWKYNYSSELYHAKRGRPKGSRIVNGKVIPPAGWSPVEEEKKDKAQYDERLQSLESKVDNLLKELKGE